MTACDYVNYCYLWPPRPETKVPPTTLGDFERRGYWAQRKKNGTRTLVFARGNDVRFKTRHGDEAEHEQWQPLPDHKRFFSGFKQWNVFDAELVHAKVSGGPRNLIYLFDQLVSDGRSLVGSTLLERQLLLAERYNVRFDADDPTAVDSFRVAEHVVVARNFLPGTGFRRLFDERRPEDEGLVLKRPDSRLQPCVRPSSNSGWQVKCRAPRTNLSF